ncbi:MAG: SIS domain-containing protein [candidate division WOR-3 bacterium]
MNKNLIRSIIREVKESSIIKEKLLKKEIIETIIKIADAIVKAYKKNKKVILFGNGGSAADAQHIAAELVGKYRLSRPGLNAIALTTNTSSLTAISNDLSFEAVFARQIEAIGQAGDVAIGITTSGKSKNIIEALRIAKKKGLIAVVLTGIEGEYLKKSVDYLICVPSKETPRIQETHILIGHILCGIVEKTIFANEGRLS